MLDHTKRYVEKIHYVDAELAGNVHKLDVKLQFVWEWLAVRILAKIYHLEVNWPTTLYDNKVEVHFFILKLECHNSHNNLLLCVSANGDIA